MNCTLFCLKRNSNTFASFFRWKSNIIKNIPSDMIPKDKENEHENRVRRWETLKQGNGGGFRGFGEEGSRTRGSLVDWLRGGGSERGSGLRFSENGLSDSEGFGIFGRLRRKGKKVESVGGGEGGEEKDKTVVRFGGGEDMTNSDDLDQSNSNSMDNAMISSSP